VVDHEHDYIVEIPPEVTSGDIVDGVRGYFKAEVQIIVCKECGRRSVGWRVPVKAN